MQNEKTVAVTDEYLDCTGLRCPMPIVKMSKILKDMPPGRCLTVEATDPAFLSDVRAWVRAMDYELVETREGTTFKAVIRKPETEK